MWLWVSAAKTLAFVGHDRMRDQAANRQTLATPLTMTRVQLVVRLGLELDLICCIAGEEVGGGGGDGSRLGGRRHA